MTGNRRRWVVGCVAFILVSLVVANILVFPRYFGAEVYFEWQAKRGFSTIYVFPPSENVGALKRVLGGLVALEARPFIGKELRRSGWDEAKGYFLVQSIPFPPIVTGLNRSGHSTLIDPKVTPLMQAAEAGDLQAVKTLLASGADVNAHDQRGWTPLMHASMSLKANAEVVRTLMAAGADVNAKDRVGRTALIWAAWLASDGRGKVGVLLAAHADPNAKSSFGETPLERVVGDAGALDVAAQLLAAGADPNARVLNGTTPLSLAQEAGRTEMARLLRRAGARQ